MATWALSPFATLRSYRVMKSAEVITAGCGGSRMKPAKQKTMQKEAKKAKQKNRNKKNKMGSSFSVSEPGPWMRLEVK
jgi:hypothetical protein